MSVYQAINAVQRALSAVGIGKDRKNQQQGYNFRGIDDIYNAVSPMLSEHGLCILPRVLSRDCVERQTAKGNALFYVTVEVEFDFVAAKDGSKHTVKTYGEAMDSADKATNKAMSAAYKYAVMQAFAIPTEGDNDADAHHHEVKPAATTAPADGVMPPGKVADWMAAIGAAATDELPAVRADALKAAELARDRGAYAALRAAAIKREKGSASASMKRADYTDDAAMARLGREVELQRQREAIERDLRSCFTRITRPGWNDVEDEIQAMEALFQSLRAVYFARQQLEYQTQ